MVGGEGMRYITETPRWYAVFHPALGTIIVECMDISTPCDIIVRDTKEELKQVLGEEWPSEQ